MRKWLDPVSAGADCNGRVGYNAHVRRGGAIGGSTPDSDRHAGRACVGNPQKAVGRRYLDLIATSRLLEA
jgi:hypothetical protein